MSVPTSDPEAFKKDVQQKIAAQQSTINFVTHDLEIYLGTTTVAPPDKSEALPLPGFIKDMIVAKGIPFAKNVAFTPDVSWNFKSGTLGSAEITIIGRYL